MADFTSTEHGRLFLKFRFATRRYTQWKAQASRQKLRPTLLDVVVQIKPHRVKKVLAEYTEGVRQMNDIHGINGYPGLGAIQPYSAAGSGSPSSHHIGDSTKSGDQVEISLMARFLSRVAAAPSVRADKVEALRAALASGDYDVEAKLPETLDRLLDDYLSE